MTTKEAFDKLKPWLIKNWLVMVVAVIVGSVLLLLGVMSFRKMKMSTPIAAIELEDSLKVKAPASRLESYREEMEEMNKQQIRRQLAMEKIISMDFGSLQEKDKPATVNQQMEQQQEEPKVESPDVLRQKRKLPPQKTRRQEFRKVTPVEKEELKEQGENPFYMVKAGKEENVDTNPLSHPQSRLFSAVVNGDQKLLNNASVSFRMLEEVKVGGQLFPRNTLVYGRLSGSSGGRLRINISKIRSVTVKMQVYDQDEQPGIPYLMDEPLSSTLDESSEDVLDQLMYSVPYGGLLGGVAEAGRRIVRKGRKSKAIFLADGYPLYIGFEKDNVK